MFLTKSSISLLLLFQYLVISSFLFSFCLSIQCVEVKSLSQEDELLINELNSLNKKDIGLISSDKYGRVYLLPNDNSKIVRIQTILPNEPSKLKEIDYYLALSIRDFDLNGIPRLAPILYKVLCVNVFDGKKFAIMISEMFRGDLNIAANQDPRFNLAMLQLSARMEFYNSMLDTFGQIAKIKYKHCDLTPENILYKENDANWDADYDQGQEPLTYFPVLTGFRLMVPWDQSCKGASPSYTDPEDYENEIRFFDNDKAKVELYSMALIIFFMETTTLTNQWKLQEALTGFTDKLHGLSGHSNQLTNFISKDKEVSDHFVSEIFQGITKINQAWNEKKVTYDHDKLKSDLEFVISAMNIYYESILTAQGADESQIGSLKEQYNKFTNVLLSMVKKNSVTIDKRPTNDEVMKILDQVQDGSQAIEDTIGARRNLVLI